MSIALFADADCRTRRARPPHLATEFTGLCPAGVDVLADAAGVSTSTMINAHGVMAGGTEGKRTIKPISHLDFGAIDAAFGDAVAACGS